MGDIARAAGVSVKTVESIFGTKARLLTVLGDLSVAGDDETVAVAQRPWFREILDEPDPWRQLDLLVRSVGRLKRRTAALNEVIRRAAQSDREIAQLWQVSLEQFMADQRLIAESLAGKNALRPGMGVNEAAETIRALNHPSFYYLMVHDSGWSEEGFERWLTGALTRQLLP